MAQSEIDIYDDFLANVDEDFKSNTVNEDTNFLEGTNFLHDLTMQRHLYDERLPWNG